MRKSIIAIASLLLLLLLPASQAPAQYILGNLPLTMTGCTTAEPKAAAPPPPPKVVQLTTTQRLAYQAIMRMLDEVQMEVCAGARIAPDRCQVEWQGGIVREVVPPPPETPPPAPPKPEPEENPAK